MIDQNADVVDLREFVATLWVSRIIIIAFTIFSVSLAAIYAFVIAKPVYESTALLLPTQSSSGDQLGAAAAFLGKKNGNADADLYQGLLTSRTVMQKLLRSAIRNESDTANGRIEPLFKTLGLDTANFRAVASQIEGLALSISVGPKENSTGGILEVKSVAGAPWLAQQIGDNVIEIGQAALRQVRVDRSEVTLPRFEQAVSLARAEWDSAARKLTWYRDRNRSIILPDQILAVSRLEIEKQAKEQKYLLVRKEYELQILERVKAAPPMMILDSANMPTGKAKPKRKLILMLGFVVGFVGSSVGVLAWKAFSTSAKPDWTKNT